MVKKLCEWCGKSFKKYPSYFKNRSGLFCSKKCMLNNNSVEWKVNNPMKGIDNSGKNNPMYGKTPHNFKPEGSRRKDGYMRIFIKGRGRLLKHRVIVEGSIGRKLLAHEIVHHVDGDNTNNDINNLKIMTQSEHARLHTIARHSKGKSLLRR